MDRPGHHNILCVRFSSRFEDLQVFLMLSNKAFGESRLVKPVRNLSVQVLDLQLLSHGAVPTS